MNEMNNQPEAIRLAECLDYPLHVTMGQFEDAAAELRRLHERDMQADVQIKELLQQRAELLEALKEANYLDEINIKMFRIERRRKKGSTGIAVDDDDDALAWRKLTNTAAQLIARRNKAITRAEAAE